MKRVVALMMGWLAVWPASVFAQTPPASSDPPASPAPPVSPATAMFPVSTSFHLFHPFGEPTFSGAGLWAPLAVLPLQLSLLGDAFPLLGTVIGGDPCGIRAESASDSTWGFPMQKAADLKITPQLTLHGFSRLGCALDAGVGGAVSYAAPLAKHLWIVGSAGFLDQPSLPAPAKLHSDARVDLMMRQPSGRALGVGVGVDATTRRLTLTGMW